MNKEWSELHKKILIKLKKETTFTEGMGTLFELRRLIYDELLVFKKELRREEFNEMPFINAQGYHNKTIAYSIWHIFRIEDIVAHTLMAEDEQIFFAGNYQEQIGAPIITTGNELIKHQIAAFSDSLDIESLYRYISEVKEHSDELLRSLTFSDLRRRVSDRAKEQLESLQVVARDENAYWLVDYWCGKEMRGLVQMPFSRHWIMHVQAGRRILEKLRR